MTPYELFLTRFKDFTEVQKLAMGPLEEGSNCMITAPTGSGKTEAALLPVFNRIVKSKSNGGIIAIYITPLRALNRDLIKRLEWMGSELGIAFAVRHGDTSQSERRKQSKSPPQLLITTPETIQNILLSKRLRSSLKNLKTVIVDELHELYCNKRGAQLSVALERIEELSGEYQRIGISATIGDLDEASRFMFGARKFKIISSKIEKKLDIDIEMPTKPPADDKEFRMQFGLDVKAYARLMRVGELIRDSKATLVFANTRQAVESVGSKLLYMNKSHGFGSIGIHHGSIDKNERVVTENMFKSGSIKALIATSSLELGIDIGQIDLVVQYGSPRQAARLVQRVGRGGHSLDKLSRGKVITHDELDCLEAAAVAESALSMKLEKNPVEKNALGVLANQICAMSLEYGSMELGAMAAIIRRSYVYESLTDTELDRVLKLASELKLIRHDGSKIYAGPRARKYFIGAISVIPDTVKFVVKDAMENKIISTLDEEFVSNYIEEGSVFITKGLPWKTISVEENTILVESCDDVSASVPDWDGEDIPVSMKIAEKVWSYLSHDANMEKPGLERNAAEAVSRFIKSNRNYFIPSEDRVQIEELENSDIAYLPLGKKANEFLARCLSIIASSYAGGKVNAKATPYSVILDYSDVVKRPDARSIFDALKNMDVEGRYFISDSDIFRYKFIQSARLFGAIDKGATVTRSMANRIIEFYADSPISDETFRDLYKNYFDIDVVKAFMGKLREGRISVEICKKSRSPVAMLMLNSVYKYGELLSNQGGDRIAERMFEKFEGRSVKMLCTYCSHVFNEKIALDREAKIYCHSCRSPMIVNYDEKYEALVRKRLSGKTMNRNDADLYKRMMREVGLVDAYGGRAIAALSVYGIGIETAARLLKYIRSDYRLFFADITEAQKNFIKNKKFWKID